MGATVHASRKLRTSEQPSAASVHTDNAEAIAGDRGKLQVGAGTAWLWARPDAHQSPMSCSSIEAAQMSLANVLAVSQAANSIVLLGDPRQLEQPMQGSHFRRERTFQRSITFSESTPPFRPIADCSWKKRGACIRISAPFTSGTVLRQPFARAAGPSAANQ